MQALGRLKGPRIVSCYHQAKRVKRTVSHKLTFRKVLPYDFLVDGMGGLDYNEFS